MHLITVRHRNTTVRRINLQLVAVPGILVTLCVALVAIIALAGQFLQVFCQRSSLQNLNLASNGRQLLAFLPLFWRLISHRL
jgi:hypothetical protein